MTHKSFKELGIKTAVSQSMVGDKIKIKKVLNREILVHGFRLENSKFNDGNTKCLYLQISIGEEKHVIFTSSVGLIDAVKQVPENDFPFATTIVEENERFLFT